MAGGSAINVFKFNTGGLPKETLNAKLWFAVFAFGLMGAARGVDEGLITGVFNSHAFKQSIGIDDLEASELASIKGTISSMVQLGSVAGALFAFVVCDRIGRVWATRQLCVFWILGIAIFIGNNGNLILAKRHPDVETIEISEETASDSDDDELTLEGGSAMAPWPQCPCGRKRRRRSDCASRSQTYRSLEHGKQSRHRNTVGHQTKPDDAVTVIMEH
ncbi:Major facilitator superfamily domain general substrate transporter [Penicillium brevicompactum]|uniref:Major facilitator superfamily domain general substrate transporter n=1 Tax=Penicillium brevicompactum TaxID=5074 RepID=A0A9W9UB80_PENBR|nr:Major facilitator superfamily domain general substrate transporter [Penicillium brevicompactum]